MRSIWKLRKGMSIQTDRATLNEAKNKLIETYEAIERLRKLRGTVRVDYDLGQTLAALANARNELEYAERLCE